MDVAYDHVQEETLPDHEKSQPTSPDSSATDATSNSTPGTNNPTDFRAEITQTYQAFTQSAWGSRLGGFWASAKKQGESYYESATRELAKASEASKDHGDFISQTGSMTLKDSADASAEQASPAAPNPTIKEPVPESLTADIAKEARSIFASFRTGAGSRLKKIQAAEDAADEALLKFGSNIYDFLREAVVVTGPDDGSGRSEVLFESRDSEGKRVVHATRFDAQLHVIHSRLASFTEDPASDEFPKWTKGFDVEKKTDAIAADLDKYPELRRSMEKLVPEKVEYADFWTRYYFLRHVIETEEQKRRELLRNTRDAQEEVSWDDEEEDEEDKAPTPNNATTPKISASGDATPKSSDKDLLKPSEGRKSNEHSVAGSDVSYDIVSGATSRAPGSPREDREDKKPKTVAEDSDEEDWE